MSERFEIPMPMWRALYRVRGGHGRVLGVPALIAAAMGLGIFLLYWFTDPRDFPGAASAVIAIVMLIECSALVLGGSNAIHKVMLRDYETRMIDSHRLTPMTNIGAVLGYLIGPTLQILAVSLAMAVMGAVLAGMGGMSISGWAIGHLFLINGVLTIWAFAVFVGMRLGKPVPPGAIVIVIASLSVPILFLPGFGLLTGAYTLALGFWLITGSTPVSVPALYAIAAVNLALTVFWVTTSAVKYRRPDLPALNAGRGMVLLVIWLLLATGGIALFDYATRTAMGTFHDADSMRIQWLVTMIASLAIAAIPISGAVECGLLSRQGRALRGWTDRWGSLSVAVLAGVLICAVMAGVGWSVQPDIAEGGGDPWADLRAWAWSVTACVFACVTIRSLLELTSRWARSRWLLTGFFVLLLWALPPVLDGVRADFLGGGATELSALLGCSPAGMIAAAWLPLEIPLLPGAVVQGLIAAALTGWVRLLRRS